MCTRAATRPRCRSIRRATNQLVINGPLRNRLATEMGSFADPDGETWLYVSLVITPQQRDTSSAIAYALPQPNQTLREALDEFSGALAVPLLEGGLNRPRDRRLHAPFWSAGRLCARCCISPMPRALSPPGTTTSRSR